ncbi:MAG TPA: AAA family ATPase, partial [Terriglobales bacterium]|nr:AAA family ATPase [Terriglobales bacterium]
MLSDNTQPSCTLTVYPPLSDWLAKRDRFVQYHLKADKPGKKPRKKTCQTWRQDPKTWRTLEEIQKLPLSHVHKADDGTNYDCTVKGVQFVVYGGDRLVWFDLDGVRNPDLDVVEPWAQKIVDELGGYWEVSASGCGLHGCVIGTLPRTSNHQVKDDPCEIYCDRKLIAITGNIYQGHNKLVEPSEQKLLQVWERAEKGEFSRIGWRDKFHTVSELGDKPTRVFIQGILAEGITGIGALSDSGKTWIGLSMSHALITGEPLFGNPKFKVLERVPVLYLVPEMGGRAFRARCIKMRLPQDGSFFCQTVRDGAISLADKHLIQAIRDMHPYVWLDTAIRFDSAISGNDSNEVAQGLGASMFNLIREGAAGVGFLHHRTKASKEAETMDLENTFRGSTDFGAMCDLAWGVEHAKRKKGKRWDEEYTEESRVLTRLFMKCVKPRDMDVADPFIIQGRPYIDDTGDFHVLSTVDGPVREDKGLAVIAAIKRDDTISHRALEKLSGWGHERVTRFTGTQGYVQKDGKWIFNCLGGSDDCP